MNTKPTYIRTRLSAMMFIEYFLWASWYVPLGGYANGTLKLSGAEIGWLYATTAIAAMVSPLFVGYVADRLFATERILAALQLLGAVCLFFAAQQTKFSGLMAALLLNALCFMPTLALANSLTFRNIDDREKFSRIAVFGTIGWIVSGNLVSFALGERTNRIFYLAAASGVVMALYSFTCLPHTPPKRDEAKKDVLGLGAISLLRDPSFLVFAICAFLIAVPLSFYFTWGNAFLNETDSPKPTALQTLCQVSEIFVMMVMPWFIGKIGLKWVIVIGMAAWAVRYLLFATLQFPLILIALLVHGFCYCFVFVASFIFGAKKAPEHLAASAQSFVGFIIWGVGMFVGTQLAGFTAGQYPPQTIAAIDRTEGKEISIAAAPLPDWSREDDDVQSDFAKILGLDAAEKTSIQALEQQAPDPVVVTRRAKDGRVLSVLAYKKADLLAAMRSADTDKDGAIARPEWRRAQSHIWPPIWLWPAALSVVACVIFILGGREPSGPPKQA